MSQRTLLLANGKAAHCYEAASAEADLEAMTWTFRIDEDTKVSAGRYLLVPVEEVMPPDSGSAVEGER